MNTIPSLVFEPIPVSVFVVLVKKDLYVVRPLVDHVWICVFVVFVRICVFVVLVRTDLYVVRPLMDHV